MNEPKTHEVIAPAKKPDTVQSALEKMKPQFAMVLPKHLTPERLCRVAMNACHATPKLLECERTSLFSAIMRSAQLGLEPDGVLGQAYLIPFKKNTQVDGKWTSTMEVQFIVGYKGLIDLARRSGDVSNIIAKEVYANDEFTIDWAQEIPFTHKPKMDGDRGELTHFWAMARFKDGGFHWDYLTKQEVEAIRDKGNGGKNAVWKDHFVEMGKKTAIRRIAKYLPMSVQRAAITEDLQEAGRSFKTDDYGDIILDGEATVIDAPPEIEAKGTQGVKDALKGKKPSKEEKAAAAGANPETGEIITPEPANEPAQTDNVAQIPLAGVAGNASLPDTESWKLEFMKRCNSATSLGSIAQLYINNAAILNQFKTRFAEVFAECEQVYNDNLTRLQ